MKTRKKHQGVLAIGTAYLVSLALLGCAATAAIIPKDHPMASDMTMIHEAMQKQFVKGYNTRNESLYTSAFADVARPVANAFYQITFNALQKEWKMDEYMATLSPDGLPPTITIHSAKFERVESHTALLTTRTTITQTASSAGSSFENPYLYIEGFLETQWIKVGGTWSILFLNFRPIPVSVAEVTSPPAPPSVTPENVENWRGLTPLMLAAARGDAAGVQALLNKGADVNEKNKVGKTALMQAAGVGYITIVQALLDSGADVDVKDQAGQTALMQAVMIGDAAVVQTLLAKGADVHAKDENGRTALMLATERRYDDIAQMLIQAGAKE